MSECPNDCVNLDNCRLLEQRDETESLFERRSANFPALDLGVLSLSKSLQRTTQIVEHCQAFHDIHPDKQPLELITASRLLNSSVYK